AGGANTMAALCLLSATDARTVLRDFETLVDARSGQRVFLGAREASTVRRIERVSGARGTARPATHGPQTKSSPSGV
ncbi:hypothetical protein ABZ726_36045, partial [Streptomyces hundungensis]